MHPEQNDLLVVSLRNAARDLLAQDSISDLEQTLTHIVAAAVETVPGADAGGISMMTEQGHITSRAATGDDIRKLDELQVELTEGPCITAVLEPPADGRVGKPQAGRPSRSPAALAHFGFLLGDARRPTCRTHLGSSGGPTPGGIGHCMDTTTDPDNNLG